MTFILNGPKTLKMFLSLPPYFKAFLPLVIISTICLFMILSYQKTYSHQKEEIFVNKNNILTSKAMDSILKVIRNQIEARKREKEQNVIAAGGLLKMRVFK